MLEMDGLKEKMGLLGLLAGMKAAMGNDDTIGPNIGTVTPEELKRHNEIHARIKAIRKLQHELVDQMQAAELDIMCFTHDIGHKYGWTEYKGFAVNISDGTVYAIE